MRLKVNIRNAKDCRIELSFPDLSVKYNNGWAPALHIKEGNEIPLDVLDPEDVRKSLRVGSLKGYMENGWVSEIVDDAVPLPEQLTSLSHFITEQMVSAPGMIAPLKVLDPVVPATDVLPAKPNLLEEVKVVEKSVVVAPKPNEISDTSLVKTFEDFERLSHTLKLRFIKDCLDPLLLRDILSKTPSNQFKNNINFRLTQIKGL